MADLIPARLRRRALVVAHPDDETLWAGGLLLRFPGAWHVICCSVPARDPERADRFIEACRRLGVTGYVHPHTEQERLARLDELELQPYDLLVTHGALGEYGHEHHKQTHRHVLRHANGRPVVTFGYRSGLHKIELSAHESARKLHALQAYDHQSRSDAQPKWRALLDRYGEDWLKNETFDG